MRFSWPLLARGGRNGRGWCARSERVLLCFTQAGTLCRWSVLRLSCSYEHNNVLALESYHASAKQPSSYRSARNWSKEIHSTSNGAPKK